MAGFIFGGNTGETADSLARKRKIAEALLAPGHTPRNWQEGLTDVAHALSGRIQLSKVEKAESARRQGASDAVAKALGSYGPFPEAPAAAAAPGGSSVAAALNGTTAPKPADPNLPSRMDFARAEQAPGGDVYSAFMDTVQAGGVTNPHALAAIAATGQHESAFAPENVGGTWSDPSQSGQAGTSGGIMSWRDERLAKMQQFAAQNGGQATPQVQAQFFLQENPKLIAQLQAARSSEEAQQLMNNAWRFAGYDQPGGEAAARIATANSYAGQFGGGGGLAALDSMASKPVQVAQAGGDFSQFSPAAGGTGGTVQPGQLDLNLLFEAARNPDLNDHERGLINVLLEQEMGKRDPLRQMQIQKLQRELETPQKQWQKLDDETLFDPASGEVRKVGGAPAGNSGFRFKGTSVEAQSLNGLMDANILTPEQAQQLGAGKTVSGTNGEILFLTPQGVFGQSSQGGPSQPVMPGGKAPATPGTNDVRLGMIPLTEPRTTIDERKAATFADRMSKSGELLDTYGNAGLGVKDQFVRGNDYIPDFMENWMVSDDFQNFDQARRDFINAQLRRESGAVISTEEFDNANKQYFPQPGDSASVIEQKRQNRETVINGMKRDAGPTYDAPAGVVPGAAAEMLRRDPSLAEQFDAKYGRGSAQRILGGQ